jgi:preprotein translocase subunit SecG
MSFVVIISVLLVGLVLIISTGSDEYAAQTASAH